MIDQAAALGVAQAKIVQVAIRVRKQVLGEQPDGVGRFELGVGLAAAELGAVEIGPAIADARGQVAIAQQLDLDLVQAALAITGLHIDDAQLVVEKFALVIGVEDLDAADRRGQL